MSRPGLVLEVDERTPPLVVHAGEGFRLERFRMGTRVIYPPESLPALQDVDAAIDAALASPLDSEPLAALLRPGMRLTIAFDDISLPLPPMRTPDIRAADHRARPGAGGRRRRRRRAADRRQLRCTAA